MASYLRPRRGKKSTAESQAIVLKKGEIFFEVPDGGTGTGAGKIKMGDGATAYTNLPYFSQPTVVEDSVIGFTDSNTETARSNNATYLTNIKPANTLKTIFTNLKQLLYNYNAEITQLNNDMDGVDTDITNLQSSTTDNTSAIEAIVNEYGACNLANTSNIIRQDPNGIFTINSDGSITVNGTPSAASYILYKASSNPHDVIIKGASSDKKVYLTAHPYGGTWTKISEGDTVHGVSEEAFAINVDAGVTVNNVTVYPMLYDARFNPIGYVPYAPTNNKLNAIMNAIISITPINFTTSPSSGTLSMTLYAITTSIAQVKFLNLIASDVVCTSIGQAIATYNTTTYSEINPSVTYRCVVGGDIRTGTPGRCSVGIDISNGNVIIFPHVDQYTGALSNHVYLYGQACIILY